MSNEVCVEGFPPTVTEQELKDLFSECGPVLSVEMARHCPVAGGLYGMHITCGRLSPRLHKKNSSVSSLPSHRAVR